MKGGAGAGRTAMPALARRSPYGSFNSYSRLGKRGKESFWTQRLRKQLHKLASKKAKKSTAVPEGPTLPEGMTLGEYKMLEAFRIKPDDLDPDTEAKWTQVWDDAERLAATSANPKHKAEFEVMQRFYSREGVKNYVDVDPDGPEEEWAMGVLVNAAHFLYLADEQALLETWKDVENTYLTRADITKDAMVQAELGKPPTEYTFGANAGGDAMASSLVPEAPDWTSNDHNRMVMQTIKWSIVGIATGLAGAAAVTVATPAIAGSIAAQLGSGLVPTVLTIVASGAVSTVASASAGTATQTGIETVAKHIAPKCVNLVAQCATLPDAFMVGSALMKKYEYGWALSDLARFDAKYYELGQTRAKDIANFLLKEEFKMVGTAGRDELYKILYPNAWRGVPGDVEIGEVLTRFKDYFFDPDTYKKYTNITMSPRSVESAVVSALTEKGGRARTAYKARAAAAREAAKKLQESTALDSIPDLLRKNAGYCAFQSVMAFCKVRKMKEVESITWLKELTFEPKPQKDLTYYGTNHEYYTKYDAYLHAWNESIFCRVSDQTIQAYIDEGLAATPPTGILRNAKWPDNVPNWIVPTKYQEETYGKNTRASQWSPTVADAIGGDERVDVELLKQYCTLNPSEEREAVFARFELILTEMKTVLASYKPKELEDAKRVNYWSEMFDPRNWVRVPVRKIMIKLSPLTHAWQKQSERLIRDRMRFGAGGETSLQELFNIRQNNPACVRFLTPDDRLRMHEAYLQEYAALAAQDAIDGKESKENVQKKAASAVTDAAWRYGLEEAERKKMEQKAKVRAGKMYDAHEKAQKQEEKEKQKRVQKARTVELELAKAEAEEAGKKEFEDWSNQMRDDDEEKDEEELYEAVARAVYETVMAFPNLTDADAKVIGVRVAKEIARKRKSQKAAQDRAEARAADVAKKAADKAAKEEEARRKAPKLVMKLVKARASARAAAADIANELLTKKPDITDVELEGKAALAAAKEVADNYPDVPRQGIRQVGIEAARAAVVRRRNAGVGGNPADPNGEDFELGDLPTYTADETLGALQAVPTEGASASVVADVFARLLL